MTTAITIPLAEIEPDETINARRTRTDEGIEELKASIRAHGLIQALRVRHDAGAGKFKVIAGHRRHRVLCELATDGDTADGVAVTPSYQVPVIIGDADDETARELSQAENFIRLPQHEADTYETFRDLADRGLDKGRIAARFGIDPKRVDRMLALGRLSPVILEAWRAGRFDRFHGRDSIRAFTLAVSIEEQERVFNKLDKQGSLWSHTIRHEFGAGDRTTAKHLDFVGKDAYVAAGGTLVEDLFEGEHAVSDPALVKKLVADKLQEHVDKLLADGWSWAAVDSDLPNNWSWSWEKLKSGKKKASKADKAKAGAVVKLTYNGELEITYGVVKPAAAKPKATDEAAKEKSAPTISNAINHRLSVQATTAMAKALALEPRLGLVALLAGFLGGVGNGPVKVSLQGLAGGIPHREQESFVDAMGRLAHKSDDELCLVAAGLAARALDLQRHDTRHKPFRGGALSLEGWIDGETMTAALRETFDAADYFNSVAKPFVITAIREAINDDEARKADKLKKKELVEFAVKNVPPTGWLPPELRAPTYPGPGEVPKPIAEAPPTEPDDEDLVDEEEDEAA
ncbi:hypothetical protein EN742_00660 [Mesorhizobium sp. M4A.F.Ca.ET.020.02.1.1]|uniref:ParB/RepB/Spo0J family partition protein n=1 Tax=Mesorhizobium sp. M4A.F.Ca.ET.020.02.1.1 TaxID=2496652 RepID=UPI000FD37B19|nr:ParB/RepB/Spo0J family partition protein [Mesorhizobium sp. M4A.F.Ca.ET.020.02.1.1]RVD44890.1 hypothetical protein EN742_00660 [Mesorhizobium sp. M4A.F.Ca.ET.020.02.1.1]